MSGGKESVCLQAGIQATLGDEGGWIGKLRCKVLWSTRMLQEGVLEAQYMILGSPGSASSPSAPQHDPLAFQDTMSEEIQLPVVINRAHCS